MKCLPLYLLLLLPLARAGYFVEANFLWYNNSLDSYPYAPSGDEGCCFSQRKCSEDCVTQQRICFKDYESVNSISDDSVSGTGCIGGGIVPRATLSKPVEYIDYSEPPLDMKKNRTIPTMIRSKNSLGRLQLFIRVAIGMHIVEYFQLDFELNVNDSPMNLTLNGSFYGPYMTFALRLTLTCLPLYYGDNCSIYCKPEDSDGGHYTCLSNGTKECLPGYQNTSTDCTTCVPATGCNPDYGYCKNPGDCVCIKGYKGENCSGLLDPVAEVSGVPPSTPSTPDFTDGTGRASTEVVALSVGMAALFVALMSIFGVTVLCLFRRKKSKVIAISASNVEVLPVIALETNAAYSTTSAITTAPNAAYATTAAGRVNNDEEYETIS